MRHAVLTAILLVAAAAAAHAGIQVPVAVTGAWTRATLPHQDTAAVYMTLESQAGDELDGVSSPEADMAMLHVSSTHGGMDSMDDLDRLALPANQAVPLAPRGMHIMLMGLKHPLKAGDILHLRLHLGHGIQDVSVPVRSVGATGP